MDCSDGTEAVPPKNESLLAIYLNPSWKLAPRGQGKLHRGMRTVKAPVEFPLDQDGMNLPSAMPELHERDRGNAGRAGHVFVVGIAVVVLIRIVLHADPANEFHHFGKDSTTASHIQSQILAVVTIYLQPSSIERSFDLFMLRADRCIVGGVLPGGGILLVELLNQTAPAVSLIQQKLFRKSIFCAHHLPGAIVDL